MGLKHVAVLTQLTNLDLDDTDITDAGLKELANLKQLTELSVQFTRVTAGGVTNLQAALPRCAIKK
jgi:hypothetical protein